MCSLCGVLGGNEHWTDAVARPGVYTRNADALARRRERASRVRIANRVLRPFRLTIADWQGSAFLLSTLTGKTEIVEDLAHLWMAAERLTGAPCDPLSVPLLDALDSADG